MEQSSILTLLGGGRTPDDGHRGCPKHVEFYYRINWIISASGWLFKKKDYQLLKDFSVELVILASAIQYHVM